MSEFMISSQKANFIDVPAGCFLPQNYGRWQGPMNDGLVTNERRLSGQS